MTDWETVAENTYRLAIAGGWLYRYQTRHTHQTTVPSIVFVPTGNPITKEIKEAIWLVIDLARTNEDDPGDIADMQAAACDLLEEFAKREAV
jgi:hypothetical protein